MLPSNVPSRVAVEDLRPAVDEGRTPIRRVPGDDVEVSADVFADGALAVRARIRWRRAGARRWSVAAMRPIGNDRWVGRFVVPEAGEYEYGVEGWVDPYLTWRSMLERRVGAGTASPVDLQEGAQILRDAAADRTGRERAALLAHAEALERSVPGSLDRAVELARDPEPERILADRPAPASIGRAAGTGRVLVDPAIAQHSAWYEIFPRSTSPSPERPGTLRDLRARLGYIADLGFDVVYVPPIHPIGRTHRRGPNNSPTAPPDAPGSPWAIGSAAGGHTAIDPGLGTLAEFRELMAEAHRRNLEIAIDLAFQCSPDHPWIREHPSWFRRLPDGTVRAAENPPKKYDDIVPFDFDTPDWRELWTALKGVVEFWAAEGVRWFRVDNPHTKPFAFWRWLIAEVRRERPELMFLAEAFTRPKVMYRLAKIGFTHSYTYFAWRHDRGELVAYFRELGGEPVREFFRPHLWPNTPDILTEPFHPGARAFFLQRLLLAATLASHYGIYGPAYELLEHRPLEPGREEYRDSEKYQLRHWDLASPRSLAPEVRRLNRIRREHPALRGGRHPAFHGTDNDRLLVYSRRTDDRSDVMLFVVNLDPEHPQSGWTDLDLEELGLGPDGPFEVHDLWTGTRYPWRGRRNFVRLDPAVAPAHLLHVASGPAATPRGVG